MKRKPQLKLPGEDNIYNMQGINEDCNDSSSTLCEVRHNDGMQINVDRSWKPKRYDALRPELWDADMFTDLIRDDKNIVKILTKLQLSRFDQEHRKTLARELLRKFDAEYFPEIFRRDALHAEQFPYRIVAAPSLSESDKQRARESFRKAIPLIVKWCMCNFSYRRDMWTWDNVEPMDLSIIERTQKEKVKTGIISKDTGDINPTKKKSSNIIQKKTAREILRERIKNLKSSRVRKEMTEEYKSYIEGMKINEGIND